MANEKRLIDVDKAKKDFNLHFGGVSHAVIANKILDEQPTVDAVEVVHGKWEYAGKNIHGQILTWCDRCKGTSIEGGLFCRNCGAKMDLED